MPSPPLTSRELVDRLDARHDELIARLDELNAQIEAALAEFGRTRETAEARAQKKEQVPTLIACPVPSTLCSVSVSASGRTPHRNPNR